MKNLEKTKEYKQAQKLADNLKDVLKCYDIEYHNTVKHNFLNVYAKNLKSVYKGYILFSTIKSA